MLHDLNCLETRFELLTPLTVYCPAALTSLSHSISYITFLFLEWRTKEWGSNRGNIWPVRLHNENFTLSIPLGTEHSENRIITLFGLFGNEIGPVEFHWTVEKCMYAARKPKAQGVNRWVCFDSAFVVWNSCSVFVECWTRSLQVQPRLRNTQSFCFRNALFQNI